MVILGVLGAIGYGVYTNFIRDARDTALDQNIQTAAAELQSALALESTLDGPALLDAMSSRTTFDWNTDWALAASGNEPTTVRLQFLRHDPSGATTNTETEEAASSDAPQVGWGLADRAAIRLHLANSDNEWRCALVVLKPSANNIANLDGTTTGGIDDDDGRQKAAQLRGIWYDGGSSIAASGQHNCSPVSSPLSTAGTWNATGSPTCDGAVVGGSTGATAMCLPTNAQSWHIPATDHDDTSTDTDDHRTLHRTTAALDGG